MNRAMTSLPVPDSPCRNTVVSVAATRSACASTRSHVPVRPIAWPRDTRCAGLKVSRLAGIIETSAVMAHTLHGKEDCGHRTVMARAWILRLLTGLVWKIASRAPRGSGLWGAGLLVDGVVEH